MPRIVYRNKDGVIIPGVTTVISNLGWNTRALMHWAWKQGMDGLDYKAESKEAADIGTATMKMIEIEVSMGRLVPQDIKDLTDLYGLDVMERAGTAYESWERWRDANEFQVVAAEESAVSEELQCGGTLDLRMAFTVAVVRGRRAIADIKVTRAVYPEHVIQVATYAQMRNENYPDEPIEELHWIKLNKDNVGFSHEYLSMDSAKARAAVQVFKHLRAIHDLRKVLK